jgi:hypothetical protein
MGNHKIVMKEEFRKRKQKNFQCKKKKVFNKIQWTRILKQGKDVFFPLSSITMTFLVFKKTLIRRQVEFYNSAQGKNEKISLENDLSTIPIILRSTSLSYFFRSIVLHMLGNGNYSRKNVGRWSISGLSASACLRFFQLKMCVQAKTGIICTYVSKQGDKK